jgi:hypothetical protein
MSRIDSARAVHNRTSQQKCKLHSGRTLERHRIAQKDFYQANHWTQLEYFLSDISEPISQQRIGYEIFPYKMLDR